MKRILAVAALVLALSVSASAQREYGYGHGRSHGRNYLPDISQVTNNAHIGYGAILTKNWGSHTGLVAGWSQMVPLSTYDPFLLEYGLDVRYSFHNRNESEAVPANRKLMALDLPVSINYAIPVSNAITILPYAGLDLTFNLWGRYNPTGDKSYSYFGDKMDAVADYYRFILGAHAGVKAMIGSVTVGLCYQQDLTRLAKTEISGKIKRTRYIYAPLITVGYNF